MLSMSYGNLQIKRRYQHTPIRMVVTQNTDTPDADVEQEERSFTTDGNAELPAASRQAVSYQGNSLPQFIRTILIFKTSLILVIVLLGVYSNA